MAIIPEQQIYLPEGTGAGLQEKLREVISRSIWDGQFVPGDRLPATRSLAKHLRIARITVSLAYEELVANGYIVSRERSGFFVADNAPSARHGAASDEEVAEGRYDWEKRLGPFSETLGVAQIKPVDWQRYEYPFIFGKPDAGRFPFEAWRSCARHALGKKSFYDIADDAGDRDDPMLLDQIVKRSASGRGVSARPNEVLVTLGAQNALWLISEILFHDRGIGIAAVEEPGYPELRNLLKRCGVRPEPVPVDRDGMIVSKIPLGIDAVYVTPSHQAPTGVTMSMERRAELLARAEAENFIVIEDDYDFEISSQRAPFPALKAMDRQGRVIYVGSFSKSLFPGLRLGYLIAPVAFVDRARALRTLVARHPPGLTQRATGFFLALGHYNAHARDLRERMSRRRQVVLEALDSHGFKTPDSVFGGTSVWFEAPEGIDADQLALDLRENGVLIEPGSSFFANPGAPKNTIRIGFSVISVAKIREGITRIADGIEAQLATR